MKEFKDLFFEVRSVNNLSINCKVLLNRFFMSVYKREEHKARKVYLQLCTNLMKEDINRCDKDIIEYFLEKGLNVFNNSETTNYKKLNNLDFPKELLNEIKNYQKYIKYTRTGQIKSGNKNWLIIDPSLQKYKNIINTLEELNCLNNISTKIVKDIDFIIKKYGFDETRFIDSIERSGMMCNIIIVSSFPTSVAISKFSKYATFFIDLTNQKLENNNKNNILDIIHKNNFNIEDEEILDSFNNLSSNEIENILTRAFITTLNENSTLIKSEYINNKSNNVKNAMQELENLIGIENAKVTIKEIVNYLNVCKKRNDIPCLNMAFLGKPRYWKDYGC